MGGRRALALALLGTTWACACLVVPPLVVDWLVPHPSPVLARRERPPIPPAFPRRETAAARPTREPEAPRRIDLYGNEVANPVARYRVDDRGTLYEVHSPETEVPRLAPPRL